MLISCSKKDKLNHYLTKPVTQEELINNGFYKYSYRSLFDDNYNDILETWYSGYMVYIHYSR